MESENSEINWQLICRVCLQTSSSDMKYIFNKFRTPNEEDIVEKLTQCGGVPVRIEDNMPDRICDQCLADLYKAYNFRNTCQASYYQLLKFIKTREATKDLNVVTDNSQAEYIKVEAIYEAVFPTETDEHQDTTDANCSPESPKDNKEFLKEILGDVDEENNTQKSTKENTKADKQKSKTKVKKDKTPGVRGRKPHPISKYICHICGNIYNMQSRLNQHIKSHTFVKQHECEICAKKFASAAQIARHMNTHTGNRPYKCKYCSSCFADSSTRNKHQRIHTNERPFKCLECGKSFAYTNVLKVHMAIHTGERPYSCSICYKTFSQRHHQQAHEKTHSNFNGRNAKTQ